MKIVEDLWAAYKACIMLAAVFSQTKKLRKRAEPQCAREPGKTVEPVTLGNQWAVQTYLVTQHPK